jgi:hypothetical protein
LVFSRTNEYASGVSTIALESGAQPQYKSQKYDLIRFPTVKRNVLARTLIIIVSHSSDHA